jgi:hypothetical protein
MKIRTVVADYRLVNHPIGGRLVNRRVGLAVIAGLAAALTGVATARAAPAVPISTCGYKITTSGKYVLAADLQCPPVGAGIFIAASQVDLDLNGHTISSGESGIQVASLGGPGSSDGLVTLSKIKVHGKGLIEQFTTGISLYNVADSQVEGVTVAFNGFGIGAHLCDNCNFQANIVTQNVLSGLFLENCDGGEIAQKRNPRGIEVAGSTGIKMHDNAVTGNYVGVMLEDATTGGRTTGAQIYNNLIAGNAGFLTTSAGAGAVGIFVSIGPYGNDIHDNTVEANSAPGAPSSYDLKDDNANCGTNNWHDNTFFTANQSCIH